MLFVPKVNEPIWFAYRCFAGFACARYQRHVCDYQWFIKMLRNEKVKPCFSVHVNSSIRSRLNVKSLFISFEIPGGGYSVSSH